MIDFLKEHVAKKPVSFHMPGHKGAEFFRKYGYGKEISRLVDWDITEIAGADNLFQPKGIILETQKRYARLYDVAHSYSFFFPMPAPSPELECWSWFRFYQPSEEERGRALGN